MPWRVEDALRERGANYIQGGLFKAFAVRDGRLITGQQQYSGRKVAADGHRDAGGVSQMRIGVIGAGRIGGNAARLFAKAGHEVLVSFSRDPQKLDALAAEIGGRAGTPRRRSPSARS